jgi:CHAT domain-containing protein
LEIPHRKKCLGNGTVLIKDAVLAFLLFTGVVLMMVKRFLGTCAFGIAAAAGICAQTSAPPALLDDGRRLVAQLKLVPTADDVLFQTTGLDRSNQLLEAVVHAGLDGDATLDDWANLHRALAGQSELETQRGNFGGAIAHLNFQEAYYNSLESDYDAALKTAMQVLEMEKEHLPGLLPFGYTAMGDDLRKLGRANEALDAYRESRRLGAALGGPAADASSQGWFATLWLKIVETEIQVRNLDAARTETNQFLAAAGTGANGFHLRALIASADVMVAEGRYSEAIDAIKQAHALVNDRDPMSSLNLEVSNVASTIVSETLGPLDYTQAMTTAKRMQAELGDVFLVEPLVQASLLVRRRLAGDLDGVLRQLTGELEQSRAAGDTFGKIQALEALAATYSGFNSRDNQITALEEALDLTRSALPPDGLPNGPAVAGLYFGVLDILGSAYADAGQFGKASAMFQELKEKLHLLTKARVRLYAMRHFGAELLIGQARVLELQSKRGEAKDLLLGLLAGKAGDVRFSRGDVLQQVARLERDGGDVPASAGYYEQAIAAFSQQREPNRELLEHLEYARYLLTAAKSLPDSQAKARTHLDAAAQQSVSVNEFQARWRVEYEFGLLAEGSGDRAGAILRYRAAVARLEEVRSSLSQQAGRQSLLDNDIVQDLYAGLTGLLTGDGNSSEAWQSLERSKARSFLELLGGRSTAVADAAPELKQIHELEQQVLNVKVELESGDGSSQTRSGRDPNVVQADLYRLEKQFALARQQASLGKTRAGQSVALGSIDLDAAQKLLPPKTTLLEYAFLRDGVTAFVVTRSGTKQLRWQLDAQDLEHKVKDDLLPLLAYHSSDADVNAKLAAVSRLLIDPVAKSLPRENQRLIIVPTGYLNYLPFEALKLPDGRSMIDAFTISYLPSASALQFISARKPLLSSLFLGAIGNVSVEGAPALPGTLTEVDGIARLEPGATRVTGEDFTHDRAREALTKYDVVHFATHGDVDSNAPLFSAVLTSPGEHGSSRLWLYEIQALKLRAGLVVLSACQTGMGRLRGGDEVAGFTRTLLLAGADSVVASLWDVSDESTAELMGGFYRSLRAGMPTAEAMRSSILAVRKKFPHPTYWAAFVMTGI